jgi:hypothetical protein
MAGRARIKNDDAPRTAGNGAGREKRAATFECREGSRLLASRIPSSRR